MEEACTEIHSTNPFERPPIERKYRKVKSEVDSSIFKEFNTIYFNLKTKNKNLNKHNHKYPCDYAQAWKVFEFLTFGQTFKFFSNLKNKELKKQISSVYGFRDISLLNNYFISIINGVFFNLY